MPAHHPEAHFRARTEHENDNIPGRLKHLKSMALGVEAGSPRRFFVLATD
jgi:hypothetical protein